MNKLILFYLLYSALSTHAQVKYNSISGRVISKTDSTSLAFVNIGIVGKSFGTISNEKGLFSLEIPEEYADDSLRFSIVGYKAQSILVKKLLSEKFNLILFQEDIKELNSIIVKSSKPKNKILGSKSKSTRLVAGFPSIKRLGSEIGIKINLKKKNKFAYLENIRFYVATNRPNDTVTMRVNIYTLNSNNMPINKISLDNILLTFSNTKGWIEFDLSSYNIYSEEDVLVTLEWVNTNKDSRIMFSSAPPYTGKIYFKFASQGDWWIPRGGPVGFNVRVAYFPKDSD